MTKPRTPNPVLTLQKRLAREQRKRQTHGRVVLIEAMLKQLEETF